MFLTGLSSSDPLELDLELDLRRDRERDRDLDLEDSELDLRFGDFDLEADLDRGFLSGSFLSFFSTASCSTTLASSDPESDRLLFSGTGDGERDLERDFNSDLRLFSGELSSRSEDGDLELDRSFLRDVFFDFFLLLLDLGDLDRDLEELDEREDEDLWQYTLIQWKQFVYLPGNTIVSPI